jgi:microcystin-dependent protein
VLLATLVLGYRIGRVRAAGIPTGSALSYSGTLLTFGQPDNSSHAITLNLWVGNAIACQTVSPSMIQVLNGRFSVPLDPSCVQVIHQNANVNIEVLIDGTSMGQTPLGAVPYAVEAATASNAAAGSALAQLDPPGTVIAFAGTVGGTGNVPPPPGWLLCDGSAVSRTQYANLFAAIGTNSGAGDGASTFNLPDYRGYFLRGLDQGTGNDPDAAARTAAPNGGGFGNSVGSLQAPQVQSHSHGVNDPGHSHPPPAGNLAWLMWNHSTVAGDIGVVPTSGGSPAVDGITNIGSATTGVSIQATGGSETRPLNAAVNYLIKY